MKILVINFSFLKDSACGTIAYETYDILRRNSHGVAVYTTKGCSGIKNYKYENLMPEPYNTPVKYLKNIINYYYNFKSAKNLEYILDDFQPDIIHLHGIRSSSLTYAIFRPVIKRNIPVVMTLHGPSFVCPTATTLKGKKMYCTNIDCSKGLKQLNCILNNCGQNLEQSIRRALSLWICEKTGYNNYISRFITPSEALRNFYLDLNIGFKPDDIVTINNFLPDDEFNIIPNYSNKGYFLYSGRIIQEKGIHYLLQAIKDLPHNIEIHIVGTGNEENQLKHYVKNNKLDNVKFLGFKTREELKEEYQNCIALIVPSNWFEAFGMVNIEAFINGKPVIASNIGGIPEIVENNINGLLFEPGNVEQLKECILKYWNNPELVVEHGENAYQKAINKYSENTYYQNLIKLYEEVLNERK